MIGSMRNGTPSAIQERDGLVQTLERPGPVGDRDDLDAPVGGPFAIAGVDAEHQLGPGLDRIGHLDRVEAVDRDPEALLLSARRRPPHAFPPRRRVATQVDHVGPLVAESPGLSDNSSIESRGA